MLQSQVVYFSEGRFWKTRPEHCDIYFRVVLPSWTFVSDLSNSYYFLSVITDASSVSRKFYPFTTCVKAYTQAFILSNRYLNVRAFSQIIL